MMDIETICAVADGVHKALHEERAMKLMYEMRAKPSPARPTWYRLVPDWPSVYSTPSTPHLWDNS